MRRLLTAVVTLGALTVGLLGVTAPAHAAGEKRGASSQAEIPPGPDPFTTLPQEVVVDEIFKYLPEKSLAQLDQVDKTLQGQVTAHHDALHPDSTGFIYAHTSTQLTAALEHARKANDAPDKITKLGVAHALTDDQQTAVTAALQAGNLTLVVLANGATLPTVSKGTVFVARGGTVTTVNGGQVNTANGGTVTGYTYQ